jgi:hypothetical protein
MRAKDGKKAAQVAAAIDIPLSAVFGEPYQDRSGTNQKAFRHRGRRP